MISEAAMLGELAETIRSLGYSQEQADDWAVRIGDTPEVDGLQVIVRDDAGEVVAQLPLAAFPDFQ